MCGFVGYFGDNYYDLKESAYSILHRGPDNQNLSKGKHWSVAFNRLSIIDLSDEAMQPFRYDKITVFVNGEIYNYLELKKENSVNYNFKSKSDIEIIPILYLKYGINFLKKIEGFFSMIIIDEEKNINYLIRDRFGKKPLYYYKEGKTLFFASEIKALKKILNLKYDKLSISINLSSWFLFGNKSLFNNVYNINPGSYIEFNSINNFKEFKWYIPKINLNKHSFDEIKKNFTKKIKHSINLRLRCDVDFGIFLSGGLDSLSIYNIAKKNTDKKIYKFIANIEGKEAIENNKTDTEILNKFLKDDKDYTFLTNINAKFYNNNIVKIIDGYERVFVNSGSLIFYALSERAKKENVKVIFTGAGGDEIFGGYNYQKPPYLPDYIFKLLLSNNIFNSKFDFLFKIFGEGNHKNKISKNLLLRFILKTKNWHAQSLSPYFQPLMGDINEEMHKSINKITQEYFNYSLNLGNNDIHNKINFSNIYTTIDAQNYDADMGCMNSSIENRSPYLDHKLFEYMLSVPSKLKYYQNTKQLQKKLLQGILPKYVLEATKSGPTMPIHLWFEELNKKGILTELINRNNYLIAELISEKLYFFIKKDITVLFQNKYLPAFAIISFLIWAKINIENSISDTLTPLLEIK